MPRIDQEIKLDFKDVLIRPKRSTLRSRAEVCETRKETRALNHMFYDFMNEFLFRLI